MSDADDHAFLLETSAALVGAAQSPWEPACLSAAFAAPRVGQIALTMQGWIELERLRSPLLLGGLPETAEAHAAALEVFGLALLEETSAEEIALLNAAMLEACRSAFATSLPMREPGATGGGTDAGFGTWLPVYAFLVSQCGVSPEEALGLRVDRAYALLAAARYLQGWETGGVPYAVRDVGELQTPNSKLQTPNEGGAD